MLDKEDLQAIAQLMDAKLQPINDRLDKMENDIAEIKENTAITRSAVNTLLNGRKKLRYKYKCRYLKKLNNLVKAVTVEKVAAFLYPG